MESEIKQYQTTMDMEDLGMMYWLLICSTCAVTIVAAHEIVRPVDRRWISLGRYSLPAGPGGSFILGALPDFWKNKAEGTTGAYVSLGCYMAVILLTALPVHELRKLWRDDNITHGQYPLGAPQYEQSRRGDVVSRTLATSVPESVPETDSRAQRDR